MIDHALNILGGEWMIIIFVALVLFLGTGQLPGAARKLGKVVSEYNKAKTEVQNQIKEVSKESMDIPGPVENERQKNEIIAKSLGISPKGITDEELQKLIEGRMGQKKKDIEK
ncbi:MAG: twin-arginine translocase TatA/TatE family subunit [Nitrosopumilus sp.]|nr:twin-arginine translocase TatA/TatE family subunit [Nitrosopumilus sp.]